MLLSTIPILQITIFSTLIFSSAVPDPARNIDPKSIPLQGECIKQGGLCTHAPCCRNSGLACRVDGHGMHFCELDNPSPRSTLDTFHEIFQKFRGRASPNLNSFPIPLRHQSGDGIIAGKDTCSKAGSSCDFHKGEHCCPSLVCHMIQDSGLSECRLPTDNDQYGNFEDEEILDMLRRPYQSLEQTINLKAHEQEKHENEEKKEGVNKWDFLKVIEMPPRLDDITELPKCKPINMKCNPIIGIRVCCPELDCMQVGPAFEDFECRKAPSGDQEEKKGVSGPTYSEGKKGGRLQWFLSGWGDEKSKDSGRETKGRNGESERIDDDEVLSFDCWMAGEEAH